MELEISQEVGGDKFRELVLFICQRSEGDVAFGATKLNKLLFYSDFLSYKKLGKPITGARYQRLPNGPAPRCLLPVLEDMQRVGEVAQSERNFFGRVQKRTMALRDPDLTLFSGSEIALVTELIEKCWNQNASWISEQSHRFMGWQLADDREDIPYSVALVEFEDVTDQDLKFAERNADYLRQLAMECEGRESA
jgi:hypothetical protein